MRLRRMERCDLTQVEWGNVWSNVSEAIEGHIVAEREHLLTEDVLRFTTALELQRAGISAKRILTEYRAPREIGGYIDLVIDDPPSAAVEFKFPRDPKDLGSADTMTYGELLKDFLRMATLGVTDGWIVQLIGDRLRRYLSRRKEYAFTWDANDVLRLAPASLELLPATALGLIPRWGFLVQATFRCTYSRSFYGWTLATYQVESLTPSGEAI